MTARRSIAFVLLAAFALPQTGCIGSFRLTDKVFQWNRQVGPLFVQEVLFLAFVILPVYEITVFVDAVVLNLIEAFTGSNPLSATEPVRDVALTDGRVLRFERLGDHRLRSTLLVDGAASTVREFDFRTDGMDVRGADGALVASASMDADGGLTLLGARGETVAAWSPATVRDAESAFEDRGARGLAAVVGTTAPQAALAGE